MPRRPPPDAKLFPAAAACEACGVTPRMLDYWVTTGIVEPTRVYECDVPKSVVQRRRAYHLFDFDALVRIKMIKDLRDAGVSLQRIRNALDWLKRNGRSDWKKTWLVTDGKSLYGSSPKARDVVSTMKGERGQFVFSVVALPGICNHVTKALKRCEPFPYARYRGTIKRWGERTRSA